MYILCVCYNNNNNNNFYGAITCTNQFKGAIRLWPLVYTDTYCTVSVYESVHTYNMIIVLSKTGSSRLVQTAQKLQHAGINERACYT